MTESKQDGYAEGQAHFLSIGAEAGEQGPLGAVADYALQSRGAVDQLGGPMAVRLPPLVDALVMQVGREIAALLDSLDEDGDAPGDPPGPRH